MLPCIFPLFSCIFYGYLCVDSFKQFDTLDVSEFEKEVFDLPEHGQNYFEIMYILKGSGTHSLNGHKMDYAAGSVFLISPGDRHTFLIASRTHFFAIKYTEGYALFWERRGMSSVSKYTDRIVANKFLKERQLHFSDSAGRALAGVIANIRAYEPRSALSSSLFIFHQFQSILSLIMEQQGELMEQEAPQKVTVNEVLHYIHRNIYLPDKLKAKKLAAHFHVSENYFGTFFKKHFHIGFKEYIDRVRYPLIKRRIDSGQLRMKEIAAEFGFSDTSHLFVFRKRMEE